MTKHRTQTFVNGLKDGMPIGAGYFAVSFALGMAAKQTGMNAVQAGAMSAGMMASAGEFAALSLIRTSAGVLEMILTTIVVNLRYVLMSCALTQKLSPDLPRRHRFALAHTITDELFGLSIAVDGPLRPAYTYGAFVTACLGWTIGTVEGLLVGNILSAAVVGALGVSLYGMFLAIIIPPAKRSPRIGILVAVSMGLGTLMSFAPHLKNISTGFRVILLTILIAGVAAFVWPVQEEEAPGTVPDTAKEGGAA